MPKSIDWSGKGAVTSIKNLRLCGAWWAISSIAATVGTYVIITGIKFSE